MGKVASREAGASRSPKGSSGTQAARQASEAPLQLLLLYEEPDLRGLLQGDPRFTLLTLSGEPSIEEIGKHLPDLLLLDPSFLEPPGVDLLAGIAQRFPSIAQVIWVPVEIPESELVVALKAGARGYIMGGEQLSEQLLSFGLRRALPSATLAAAVLAEFQEGTDAHGPEGDEALSEMERKLLLLFQQGKSLEKITEELGTSAKFVYLTWEGVIKKLYINEEGRKLQGARQSDEGVRKMETKAGRESGAQAAGQGSKGDGGGEMAAQQSAGMARTAEMNQLVSFRLGKEEFALDITQLQEIQRMLPITTLPRVPAYVEGIVNLRGRIIPIIDLRKKLGMEEGTRDKETRIVVVSIEGNVLGLIVDSVSEVLRISPEDIEPPPPLVVGLDAEFILGVAKLEERLILLLDLKRIVTREERKALQTIGG